jgi:molecular chaperone GrpE
MPDQDPDEIARALAETMAEAEKAVDDVRRPEDAQEEQTDEARAELEAELAVSKKANSELRDKWLRAVADHENFKKRVKKETNDTVQRGLQRLLNDFLPVADNLERALQLVDDPEDKFVEGIQLVRREFFNALAKHEIKPIDSVGQPFDPSLHDALQQIDSPEHAPGVIIQEFERGYMRGDRLFRAARVIVAGPGSTGEAASDDGADESE